MTSTPPTNILIVDDEILVRIALKTLIAWQEHGFAIIGEVENGIQALQILKEKACDIVLTDIRMPEMDGISLIGTLSELYPNIRTIILSNHNDFEYVQKALRLGAVDYILKLAWVPEELLDKCVRIQNELNERRLKRMEQFKLSYKMEQLGKEAREKQLRDLFTKHSTRIEVDHMLGDMHLSLEGPYRVVCVSIDHYQNVIEENRFKSEQLLGYTIANIMTEILKKIGGGELVEVRNGKFAILPSAFDPDGLIEIRAATATYARVSISFGISNGYQSAYEIQHAYAEAEKALERRFFLGEEHLFYVDAHADDPTRRARVPAVREEGWVRIFEQRASEQVGDAVRNWAAELKQAVGNPPDIIRDRWMQLLSHFNRYLKQQEKDLYMLAAYMDRYPYEVIRNAETLDEIAAWFAGWLTQSLESLKKMAGNRFRPEIQVVMDILHKEYHTALRLPDIAKRVGFAENYLSVLFKKETGEKIVDYLTRIRMKKARELLTDPAYKIYEISEQVGYGDSTHFSKTFKKIEGVFPLEYRKMIQGKPWKTY